MGCCGLLRVIGIPKFGAYDDVTNKRKRLTEGHWCALPSKLNLFWFPSSDDHRSILLLQRTHEQVEVTPILPRTLMTGDFFVCSSFVFTSSFEAKLTSSLITTPSFNICWSDLSLVVLFLSVSFVEEGIIRIEVKAIYWPIQNNYNELPITVCKSLRSYRIAQSGPWIHESIMLYSLM